MKKLSVAALLCVVFLFGSFSKLFAQTEQEQRIRSSYMLVFGRDASAGEVTYWKGQGNLSVAQLFEKHRQYFKANPGVHRELIVKSYLAAFGRNPSEQEINFYINGTQTYTELVKGHIDYLVRYTPENEMTINRAYQYVVHRKATPQEIGYGVASGGLTYLFWVGWLQDPSHGKGSINVNNAPILSSLQVSPNVAAEARTASGLVASGGGNLVAAGAGNLVASGAGNLVASGAGNLVASGAGN